MSRKKNHPFNETDKLPPPGLRSLVRILKSEGYTLRTLARRVKVSRRILKDWFAMDDVQGETYVALAITMACGYPTELG